MWREHGKMNIIDKGNIKERWRVFKRNNINARGRERAEHESIGIERTGGRSRRGSDPFVDHILDWYGKWIYLAKCRTARVLQQ